MNLITATSAIASNQPLPRGKEYVEYTIFSDTILMWTQPIGDGSNMSPFLRQLFTSSINKLIGMSIFRDMPIRAGVAYGRTAIMPSRRIFVGMPIINAYKTEQSQDWIGVALHSSCNRDPLLHYLQTTTSHGDRQTFFGGIVEYKVPPNSNPRITGLHWSLDWPNAVPKEVEEFLIHGMNDPRNQRYRTKWEHALTFYRHRIQFRPY